MSTTPTEPLKPLPMPLWLQGAVEGLFVALITAALVLGPLGVTWWTGAFSDMPVEALGELGGHLWMVIHAVPLHLNLTLGPEAEMTMTGTWWFIAWAATLIPAALGWRSGKRLVRASHTRQLWQPLAGMFVAYAGFGLLTSLMVSTESVHITPVWGSLIPAVLVLLAAVAGTRREAGSWDQLLGEAITARIENSSQVSRWASSYVWSMLRAAWVGLLCAFAVSGVVLGVWVFLHWAEITEVYQRLEVGVWGGIALTVVQLAAIPNLVMWAMSWLTGAGFSIGVGSLIAPTGTAVGAQPGLPLLAAIPVEQSLSETWWMLLLPLVAGFVAGWWLLREGENHLDDWVSLKVPHRLASLTLSTLMQGIILSAFTALLAIVPLWVSGGSWGIGKFVDIGPVVWASALLLGAQIGIGSMLGYLIAPLWERHQYVGQDWDSLDLELGEHADQNNDDDVEEPEKSAEPEEDSRG